MLLDLNPFTGRGEAGWPHIVTTPASSPQVMGIWPYSYLLSNPGLMQAGAVFTSNSNRSRSSSFVLELGVETLLRDINWLALVLLHLRP